MIRVERSLIINRPPEVVGRDTERGVRLLGANDAIREQLGGGPPPEWLRLGDPFSEARRALGDDKYGEAWEAGRGLTVDEAIDLAVAEPAVPAE
jgi:hypothetical protein